MGRQIGFYANHEDEQALLDVCESQSLIALPQLVPTGAEPEGASPKQFRIPPGQSYFYLLPGELAIVEAFYEELPDGKEAKLLAHTSPVIELHPSPRKGRELYNGRLYVAMREQSTLYKVVNRAYERLARAVRNWTPTDKYHFYVGARTTQEAIGGTLRLMHHNEELHPVRHP